jgi:hypothetical protein
MSKTTFVASPLTALRLAEEQACERYLLARKSMVRAAGLVASIGQMVRERPNRADYRKALGHVMGRHFDATERTRLAYECWQRTQVRADAFWTALNKPGAAVLVAA